MLAVEVDGCCRTWLFHLAVPGGSVVWMRHGLWVAELGVGCQNLGVGHVEGQELSLARAVAGHAVASHLLVVGWMQGGWSEGGPGRNCAGGVDPMYWRLWCANFRRTPAW